MELICIRSFIIINLHDIYIYIITLVEKIDRTN